MCGSHVAERHHLEVLEQRLHAGDAREQRRHDHHRSRSRRARRPSSRAAAAAAAACARAISALDQRDRHLAGRDRQQQDRGELQRSRTRAARGVRQRRPRAAPPSASAIGAEVDDRRVRQHHAADALPEPRPIREIGFEVVRGPGRSGDSRRARHGRRARPPPAAWRALSTAFSATRTCASPLGSESSSTACRWRSRLRKSMRAYTPAGSRRSTWSTRLTSSTYCRQSMVAHRRRLVITLATDAWLVACRWCSSRTMSSAVTPRAARCASSAARSGERRSSYSRARCSICTTYASCDVPRQRHRRLLRVAVDAREQRVRGAARRARVEDLVGQPAQVLDERELQHARPRPQLADRERRDALKAVEEERELRHIEAAVAVADQLDGNRVDARVARLLSRPRAAAARDSRCAAGSGGCRRSRT